jgi:hypothetical protein
MSWSHEVPPEVQEEILRKRIAERGWIQAEPGKGLASVVIVRPTR